MTISGRMPFPSRNVIFLFIRLFINQLLPFAVLPYISHKLLQREFGLIMLAQAVLGYLVVFVEYGFNYTGVRSVALARGDSQKLAQLIYEIGLAKIGLALAGICVLSIVSITRLVSSELMLLIEVGYVAVLGTALQPVWFFQGLEQFVLVGITQLASRGLCLGAIFFLVKKPQDMVIAQLLLSAPTLLSAAVLCAVAHKAYASQGYQSFSHTLTLGNVIDHLQQGTDVFISQIGTTLFAGTNTIVVGGMLGAVEAGQYSLADKLIRGVAMLTSPITEAIYPRLAAVIHSTPRVALSFARRIVVVLEMAFVLVGLTIVLCSSLIAKILLPDGPHTHFAFALASMALVPACILITNVSGYQVLLGFGKKAIFRNNIVVAGMCVPASATLMMALIGFAGAPISSLLGEALLAILMLISSFRAAGYNWLMRPNDGKSTI